MKESDRNELLDILEIKSSKLIQQLSSTLFFNGSVLIIWSLFIPWLTMYTEPVNVLEPVFSKMDLLHMGRFVTLVIGLILVVIALRSLIVKKFMWVMALICCVFYCFYYILNNHHLKSVISTYKAFYIPVTSGFLVSGLGIILVVIGGYITYVARDKEEEEAKREPRKINIKKKRKKRKPRRRR